MNKIAASLFLLLVSTSKVYAQSISELNRKVENLAKLAAVQQAEIQALKKILPTSTATFNSGTLQDESLRDMIRDFTAAGQVLEKTVKLDKPIPPGLWLIQLVQQVMTSCDGDQQTLAVRPSLPGGEIMGDPLCMPGATSGKDWMSCQHTFVLSNKTTIKEYTAQITSNSSKTASVSKCSAGLYGYSVSNFALRSN